MASDVKRPLPDLAYVSAGAASTLDIPRDNVMKALNLMLTLTLTTGAAAGSGTLADPGILQAIRRLEVVADGAVTLWSVDPASLYILNALWSGSPGQRDKLAIPANGTSGTMQAFLQIPFALPFSKNPNVTLLNASALSSLQLRVTWGSINDLVQTPTNTSINTSSILSSETHEIVGLDPRSVFSAFKVSQITRQLTASTTNLEVDLPRSNVLRGLLFKSSVLTNSVEDETDSLLNEIRVESSELGRGPFVHRRTRCTDTDSTARDGHFPRNIARLNYGLNDFYADMSGALGGQPQQETFNLFGFYPIEFMENQSITSAVRTQAFSSLKAILNVTNTGTSPTITITAQEIIPAAKPA